MEADILSHIPRTSGTLIDAPAVKAITSAVPYTDHTDYNYNPSNIVCKSTQVVVHIKSRDDWRVEQENDSIISPAIEAIKSKKYIKDTLSDESRGLLHNGSQLLFRCGLLYRKVFDGFKTQPEKAELNPIIATRPLELVHIDYLTIEPPSNSQSSKYVNILIITDHFTRYAQAHITSSQKAQIVAKTL